jgi:L,D-transpeptidase ErfK/SrfK
MRARLLAVVIACVSSTLVSAQVTGVSAARALTGGVRTHVVVKGETLGSIGARYGADPATVAADNGIAVSATLKPGQPLVVDNRHLVPDLAGQGLLVVNVPQRMLFYRVDGMVAGMPVAVGLPNWQTPVRPFTVAIKETDPTWDVPVSIQEEARLKGRSLPARVPPGPNNPLGRFWLGLSLPGVGIHSTNAPSSIYRVTTHGCIRVGPSDMEWLFPRVAAGAAGEVIYEPILLGLVGDEIYLEVHRDVYRRLKTTPGAVVLDMARGAGLDMDIDWARADTVIAARHGVARLVGVRKNPQPRGDISH